MTPLFGNCLFGGCSFRSRPFGNRALLLAVVLAAGCDGTSPPLSDAGCGTPGAAPDQPALACPAEVDVGCIEADGIALEVDVTVATCDGSEATVTCTPDRVTPGSAAGGSCTATSASGATSECAFAIRHAVRGEPGLLCQATTTVACTGARTNVEAPPPGVMSSCEGGEVGVPMSDAPGDGFPVGTTEVAWTATVSDGGNVACSTAFVVTDETPPTLDCPPQTILRTSIDSPAVAAVPSATDACDDAVEVTVSALPQMRGRHTLSVVATDDAGGTASCDLSVEVLDVFAPLGLRVISAGLAPDGSTDVTLGWDNGGEADVTGLRIERAADPSGPWTELATLGSARGANTYTDAGGLVPVGYYRIVALLDEVEGGVTETVHAYALAADDYHLTEQTVPTIRFATSLLGVVRHPMDLSDGPFPLVVFMHGNHGNCRPTDGGDDECETRQGDACEDARFTTTPNAEGYVYLQDTLASQGYVTVSVSANALNCRDGYLAERTQLILEHLRRWSRWSGAGGAPFGEVFSGAVDMSRVVLVGHSRGGEAVATAPAELRATPIAGVSIASVFGIGPTDYETPTPTEVPFAVLLPACDADVTSLEGLRQYDRGLDASDPNPRAQVLYVGANHNFFNTEWRFDDNVQIRRACRDSEQVGGPAQRGMLEVVLTDWVLSTTTSASVPAYIRAESDTPALVHHWADRDIDLRWSYSAASRLVIDDFEGAGSPDMNDLGGANMYSGMIASITCSGSCARNFTHRVSAVRPAWEDDPALMSFAIGDVDASGWEVLSMRFAARMATINDGITEHELGIRVRDASGATAEVPVSSVGRVANRYTSRFEHEVLSTVRVPLSAFIAVEPALDLGHIVAIEIGMPIAGGNLTGSVWMSDMEFADL